MLHGEALHGGGDYARAVERPAVEDPDEDVFDPVVLGEEAGEPVVETTTAFTFCSV